jgi:hypothetical protein
MIKRLIRKKFVKIIAVLMLIWCVFFATDFIRANNYQRPIFAIPFAAYRDGGSTTYFGIGYKVIAYANVSCGPDIREILSGIGNVDIGTWFMPFRSDRRYTHSYNCQC